VGNELQAAFTFPNWQNEILSRSKQIDLIPDSHHNRSIDSSRTERCDSTVNAQK
jgi:hypothetical protein